MVKTIRLTKDILHSEFLRIQGEIQAKEGKLINSDRVMEELIKAYKKKKQM